MATLSEPGRTARTIINNAEPVSKPPPVLTTGAIAWVRQNLFRTPFDAILTIFMTVLLTAVIGSFLSWAIGTANWYVIIRNMRLFMVGTLLGDPFAVEQVEKAALLVSVLVGFSVAAWWRISRGFGLFVLGLLVFLIVFPRVMPPLIPPSSTYLIAGDMPIVSGTQTDSPIVDTAFIAMAGEQVTIQLADLSGDLDDAVMGLGGFGDRPFNNLMNASFNREVNVARIPDIERQLAGTLSDADRETLTAELTRLQELAEQPVTRQYNVNTGEVEVELLTGDGETVLAQGTLGSDAPPLTATLPADGWYILRKTPVSENSTAILDVTGAYPHFARQISRAGVDGGRGTQVTQYVRLTDGYTIENNPPTSAQPMLVLAHQYRGERPFIEWVGLQFVPFVDTLGNGLIWLILLAIAGYIAALVVERISGGGIGGRQLAVRLSAWGWFLLPFAVFALVFRTSLNDWGGLFLTFMLAGVGIVASFPIGVLLALGRRTSGLPAIQMASVIFIEGVRGVPLITVLYLSNLALPLVSPSLATVPAPVRAMVAITLFSAAYLAENVRGGLQSLPPGQTEAAKALGLNAIQVTLFITLPQALRAVIPALVGQFISLFKDTSLVAIVGLLELTSVALAVTAQPEYDGQLRESFLFISLIYFVFSYAMAYASKKLESSGAGAILRTQEAA